MDRRTFLSAASAASFAAATIARQAFPGSQPADSEPRFTDPPGPETEESRALIGRARRALESKKTDASGILADPDYLPIHERTEFRQLIRDHARSSTITIVTPTEPGEAMVVTGTIRRKDGSPLKGALIYLYQTSAKGWYSDKAPHISGNSGDFKHARLFGYLRTDDSGRYEIRTIRPGGYPRSTLPQHIHLEIFDGAKSVLVSEVHFDGDPRLTPELRKESAAHGVPIATVSTDADGKQHGVADLTIK